MVGRLGGQAAEGLADRAGLTHQAAAVHTGRACGLVEMGMAAWNVIAGRADGRDRAGRQAGFGRATVTR